MKIDADRNSILATEVWHYQRHVMMTLPHTESRAYNTTHVHVQQCTCMHAQ